MDSIMNQKNKSLFFKIEISAAFILLVLLIVFLTSLITEKAYATSKPEATISVVSKEGAAIRSSATIRSSKNGIKNRYARINSTFVKFKSTHRMNGKHLWYYVPASRGYVRGDLLVIRKYENTRTGIVKGGLNTRKGAGTGFQKLSYLKRGEKIEILMKAYDSRGKLWYKIRNGKGKAFVSAQYVELRSNNSNSVKKTKNTVKKVQFQKQKKRSRNIKYVKKTRRIKQKNTVNNKYIIAYMYRTANFRRFASISSSRVLTLRKSINARISFEKFTSATDNSCPYRWFYSPTQRGYIRSDLVGFRTSKAIRGRVSTSLNLRTGAGTSFPVRDIVPGNAAIKVVLDAYSKNGEHWYKVLRNGNYLYAHANYVKTYGNIFNVSIGRMVNKVYSRPNGGFPIVKKDAKPTTKGKKIAKFAAQFEGNPYVWGGESLLTGADCSGFTQSIYARFGIIMPRGAWAQRTGHKRTHNPRPGDLVWYKKGHVGIYLGSNKMIHAANRRWGTVITYTNWSGNPFFYRMT